MTTANQVKAYVGWVAVDGGADRTTDAIHAVGQCCEDFAKAQRVQQESGYEYIRWAASDGYLYADRTDSPDAL